VDGPPGGQLARAARLLVAGSARIVLHPRIVGRCRNSSAEPADPAPCQPQRASDARQGRRLTTGNADSHPLRGSVPPGFIVGLCFSLPPILFPPFSWLLFFSSLAAQRKVRSGRRQGPGVW